MSRAKPLNVVVTTVFVGIILTFTFFLGVTSSYHGTETHSTGSAVSMGMTFERFSSAFYDNDDLLHFGDSIEYLLFGSIGSKDIILGENGFLFDAGVENSYNYLRDYIGDSKLYQNEMEALANILLLRSLAYKNNGVDYLLVVIPNSQTVYSEYMPSYMGDISENTRLNQLSSYINERGYSFFFDTTELMRSAKADGKLLYNNTENSLNALGEWYIYDAVCDRLEELYGISGNSVNASSLELFTRLTDGKTLARRAGLSSVIQNETVSLSNSSETKYTLSNYYGTMVRTEIAEAYREDYDPESVVLLEFTDDWDRILLLPYFSNTYSEVTYKTNHQFSSLVVNNLKPKVAVQFIHENQLYDMMDSGLMLTYNAGLRMTINDEITSQPILISQCMINSHTACIAGETESGATISVSVNGREVSRNKAIGDLFFVSVDLGGELSASISITAQAGDKEVSVPIQLTLYNDPLARPKNVAVGSNSQLYSTDFSWLNFLSDEQIKSVREGLADNISRVKQLTGKNTEYIYVIVPDKLSIETDDAPAELAGRVSEIERYRKTVTEVRESAGMTVIDLTEEMKNHSAIDRLYCQTGELWTGFGSYVGYHSLISHISERFTNVKVHELIDFSAVTEENVGGELVTKLGLDGAVINETYLTIKRSFQLGARFEYSGTGAFDLTKAFISYTDDSTLPVALVMRDEYGTEMLENMSDHFSKMIVLGENDYVVSDELIAEIRPDYIITIRCNGELS